MGYNKSTVDKETNKKAVFVKQNKRSADIAVYLSLRENKDTKTALIFK